MRAARLTSKSKLIEQAVSDLAAAIRLNDAVRVVLPKFIDQPPLEGFLSSTTGNSAPAKGVLAALCWELLRGSNDPDALEEFVRKFGGSREGHEARERLSWIWWRKGGRESENALQLRAFADEFKGTRASNLANERADKIERLAERRASRLANNSVPKRRPVGSRAFLFITLVGIAGGCLFLWVDLRQRTPHTSDVATTTASTEPVSKDTSSALPSPTPSNQAQPLPREPRATDPRATSASAEPTSKDIPLTPPTPSLLNQGQPQAPLTSTAQATQSNERLQTAPLSPPAKGKIPNSFGSEQSGKPLPPFPAPLPGPNQLNLPLPSPSPQKFVAIVPSKGTPQLRSSSKRTPQPPIQDLPELSTDKMTQLQTYDDVVDYLGPPTRHYEDGNGHLIAEYDRINPGSSKLNDKLAGQNCSAQFDFYTLIVGDKALPMHNSKQNCSYNASAK